MTKIIKEKTEKNIEKCPICGCLFSYEQEDIQDHYIFINGGWRLSVKVACPKCKDNIVIKEVW